MRIKNKISKIRICVLLTISGALSSCKTTNIESKSKQEWLQYKIGHFCISLPAKPIENSNGGIPIDSYAGTYVFGESSIITFDIGMYSYDFRDLIDTHRYHFTDTSYGKWNGYYVIGPPLRKGSGWLGGIYLTDSSIHKKNILIHLDSKYSIDDLKRIIRSNKLCD